MAERPKPAPNSLPTELQRQLKFDVAPSREWLVNDEFLTVGDPTHYEFLPARARVSADGTRYEVGVRQVDLEGVLELAKIVRPTVKTVDTVVNFWQNHPKFSSKVEEDTVYIGAGIEPTKEGFETEASSISFAYDVAVEAAISGRTYGELKQDERWYGSLLQQIENPGHGRTGFFRNEPIQSQDGEYIESSSCEIIPPVTVDTLRDYPLEQRTHSLHNAPGVVKVEGWEDREFTNGSWIVLQPGNPRTLDGSRVVQISIPESRRKSFDDERTQDGLTVYLQIPEGKEVQTIGDINKLKTAEVFAKADNPDGYVSRRAEVEVTMEDDSFKIVSADGGFAVELRKPCCPECQKPTWKWPSGENIGRDFNSEPKDWDENAFLYGESAGGGEPPKFHPSFDKEEGEDVAICGDCINPVVDRYKEEHPFASRTKAIELTRQRLDEAGYQGVEIMEGQVWNMGGKWDVFTKVEYEREGRKIMRYTGEPRVSHDGEVELNMLPHEYVAFRYKVE